MTEKMLGTLLWGSQRQKIKEDNKFQERIEKLKRKMNKRWSCNVLRNEEEQGRQRLIYKTHSRWKCYG